MVLTRTIAAAIEQVNPSLDLTFRTMPDIVRSVHLRWSERWRSYRAFLARCHCCWPRSGSMASPRTRSVGAGVKSASVWRWGRRGLSSCDRLSRRVLVLVGVGVLSGVGVSLWASPLLSALLHAVDPGDSLTLIGAVTLLTGFGALAGLVPAWRASRVDPMVALRYE